MLVRICPIAWDSNKLWPQRHRERKGSPAALATQLHPSFPQVSTQLYGQRSRLMYGGMCRTHTCVCVWSRQNWLCLVSILVSPRAVSPVCRACASDWMVIVDVVRAGFSGLFQLGKRRVWRQRLERTSEGWHPCAGASHIAGLLISLFLYARQSKELTEDEATSVAGSLPRAFQLLVAALEKSLRAASTGVQGRVGSVQQALSVQSLALSMRPFLIIFWLYNCREPEHKYTARMVWKQTENTWGVPYTPLPTLSFPPQPQISPKSLSQSQQLRPETVCTGVLLPKRGFVLAVLFHWAQGLCFHWEH